MIDILVDRQQCQRYGQCVLEAPHVFDLNPGGDLRYHATANEDQREALEAAADTCPVQAISLSRRDEKAP